MDAVAGGYIVYEWWTHGGAGVIDKAGREIRGILDRQLGSPGHQYSLRASVGGIYPCYSCPSGETFLLPGEVWKYGETTNFNGRYSDPYLRNTGAGLFEVQEYFGNQTQIKIAEKYKIYGHYFIYGQLPPGNKIFR